jgi:putative peptidoglycan lipid II flippase
MVRRKAGPDALHGFTRTISAGLIAGLLAAAAGLGVLALVGGHTPGWGGALAQGMLSGAVVAVVFVAVAAVTDRHTVAPTLRRLRKRTRPTREEPLE